MKINKYLFIVFLVLIWFIWISYAEEVELQNSSTWIISTWSITETIISTWSTNETLDETSYIYYYGQWCSHCANLDKYMNSVWWYDKLNIVKKEIYFDDKNRQEMIDNWKRLWLDEASIWVPFFIVNNAWKETTMIGDGIIIDYFKTILWEAPENKNKTIVFAILSILAIIIPVFLIKLSNKN